MSRRQSRNSVSRRPIAKPHNVHPLKHASSQRRRKQAGIIEWKADTDWSFIAYPPRASGYDKITVYLDQDDDPELNTDKWYAYADSTAGRVDNIAGLFDTADEAKAAAEAFVSSKTSRRNRRRIAFNTRDDVIQQEILPALGEYADDFDIDAIADEVLDSGPNGYFMNADHDEFWEVVQRHDKTARRKRAGKGLTPVEDIKVGDFLDEANSKVISVSQEGNLITIECDNGYLGVYETNNEKLKVSRSNRRKRAATSWDGQDYFVGIARADATCVGCGKNVPEGSEAYVTAYGDSDTDVLCLWCGSDVEKGHAPGDPYGRASRRLTEANRRRKRSASGETFTYIDGEQLRLFYNENDNSWIVTGLDAQGRMEGVVAQGKATSLHDAINQAQGPLVEFFYLDPSVVIGWGPKISSMNVDHVSRKANMGKRKTAGFAEVTLSDGEVIYVQEGSLGGYSWSRFVDDDQGRTFYESPGYAFDTLEEAITDTEATFDVINVKRYASNNRKATMSNRSRVMRARRLAEAKRRRLSTAPRNRRRFAEDGFEAPEKAKVENPERFDLDDTDLPDDLVEPDETIEVTVVDDDQVDPNYRAEGEARTLDDRSSARRRRARRKAQARLAQTQRLRARKALAAKAERAFVRKAEEVVNPDRFDADDEVDDIPDDLIEPDEITDVTDLDSEAFGDDFSEFKDESSVSDGTMNDIPKASAVQVSRLADLSVAAGITSETDKFAKMDELGKLSAKEAASQIALLTKVLESSNSRVASNTDVDDPRSTVIPTFGRRSSSGAVSGNSAADDFLIGL